MEENKEELKDEIFAKNNQFLINHGAVISKFQKDNKGKPHPAVFQNKNGLYIWLTRTQRRQSMAKMAKLRRNAKR